jgi:hypothetical protein
LHGRVYILIAFISRLDQKKRRNGIAIQRKT